MTRIQLRRDLEAFLVNGPNTSDPNADAIALLERSLAALGGPVPGNLAPPVVTDPAAPVDTIAFRDKQGRTLGAITGLAPGYLATAVPETFVQLYADMVRMGKFQELAEMLTNRFNAGIRDLDS